MFLMGKSDVMVIIIFPPVYVLLKFRYLIGSYPSGTWKVYILTCLLHRSVCFNFALILGIWHMGQQPTTCMIL